MTLILEKIELESIHSFRRTKYALLIGPESRNDNLGKSPSNNCKGLRDALLHADDSWKIYTLTGLTATKDATNKMIARILEELKTEIDPVFFFYFSGHGFETETDQHLSFLKENTAGSTAGTHVCIIAQASFIISIVV
jgi:hypothetical protein